MNPLILKDLFTMKRYGKTLLFILLFYGALAALGQSASFITGMSVFLFAMLSISSFSYDQYSKWDKYCISLPISRRQMVGSKYLFALGLIIAGMVFGCAMGGLLTLWQDISFWEEIVPGCVGSAIAALFMISILFPLIYRFGIEKSRMLLLVVCFVPVILILTASKLIQQMNIPLPDETTILLWLKIIPIFVGIGFIISYFISATIFQKKEL